MCSITMVPTINQFVFDAATTVLTQEVQENGFCSVIIADVPNFTNAINATLTVKDRRGYTLFTSVALARNVVTNIGDTITAADFGDIPIDNRYTLTVTLSGAAGGAGGTVKVMLYIRKS